MRLFRPHLPVISLRLFGLFGPGQQKMLPVTLLRKVRAGEPIVLEPAEGESGEPEGLAVSFSYVEDTARLPRADCPARPGREFAAAVVERGGPRAGFAAPFRRRHRRDLGHPASSLNARRPFAAFNLVAESALLRSLLKPAFTPFAEAMARTYGAG